MSDPCNRFEAEGLQLLEEGLPLPDHFASCPDCLRAQEQHRLLRRALEQPLALSPPQGWEARVLERLDEAAPAPRRRRPWALASATGAAAAAALLFLVLRPAPGTPAPTVSTELLSGGAPVRGGGAHAGDRLRIHARTGEARYRELRLFRDGRDLLLRCTGDDPASAGCARSGDGADAGLEAELVLPSPGRFEALVVASDAALPPPAATLADDSARLLSAGARVALSSPTSAY